MLRARCGRALLKRYENRRAWSIRKPTSRWFTLPPHTQRLPDGPARKVGAWREGSAWDRLTVEMPGGVPKNRKHDDQPNEQRNRSKDQPERNDETP